MNAYKLEEIARHFGKKNENTCTNIDIPFPTMLPILIFNH
jgi:hypothetical protein